MYSQQSSRKTSRHFSGARSAAPALLLAKRPKKSRVQNECCAICLQPMTDAALLEECKHSFCSVCISQWAKINLSCPLCKHAFASAKLLEGGRVIRFEPIPVTQESEEGDEWEDYDDENGDSSDEESTGGGEVDGHGYERDGFVVDDDFVEYDSADDALQSDEEDFRLSQVSDTEETRSRRRRSRETRRTQERTETRRTRPTSGTRRTRASARMRETRPTKKRRQEEVGLVDFEEFEFEG